MSLLALLALLVRHGRLFSVCVCVCVFDVSMITIMHS